MKRIISLVRWFCRQLTLKELSIAVSIFLEVLYDKRPDIKTKDDFKNQHPNYRKFGVDPEPPLTECPPPKITQPSADWKQLLEQYRLKNGKRLKPVKRRHQASSVASSIRCPHCNAPASYLYYNDGKKRYQLRCKVCHVLFPAKHRHRLSIKTKYWCPICHSALYRWKQSEIVTIYKCPNHKCPRYLEAKSKLNRLEKELQNQKSSQFKLRYQYRAYHFDPADLVPASPTCPAGALNRIHNSLDTLGLVLSFNISFGLSARMTVRILKDVFNVSLSHQTVLNYTQTAAFYCHQLNLNHKGSLDALVAGDETYIRVSNQWNYTWFTIGTNSRAIHAYHLSDSRDVQHALITLQETIRTVPDNQLTTLVADGNPSYDAAVHAINAAADGTILQRRKVIGLENVDAESAEFRAFKQFIERLNRTYKFHTRARCGFKNFAGAVALTVLFVTHYNFLRPHSSLNYQSPISLPELNHIYTIQGRWGKVLQMATQLAA